MRGRPGGTTLSEILIAGSLLLLVTGVAYATLLLVNRSMQQATARTAALVNAEVSLERLRRELQETSAASLVTLVDPPALAFLTARDASGAFRTDEHGAPEWQGYLVYYLEPSDGSLRRNRLDLVQVLNRPRLEAACRGGRTIAYGLQELWVRREGRSLTLGVTSAVSPGLRLPLTCRLVAWN